MNRLIVRYGYPLTGVILVIFAWVVVQRAARGWNEIIPLALAAAIVWAIGTPLFVFAWPRITVGGFKRAIVRRGLGDGPIPVNTLQAARETSSSAATGSLLTTGSDDLVYVAGWLDVRQEPHVLHVPDMAGRYYSVQFTEPSSGANVAYVGTRTTGEGAGEYLLTGPGWTGAVPAGMAHLALPSASALVIGRIFFAGDDDLAAARELARGMRLTPLGAAAG
ncbi:Protein of unknown function [Paramicrobacterium humi]|uniref:DUF1254 domain-containing protein n=1 Tax=Paramicrobacterium humi TaxID=640635 RepID=A0A1H4PQJ9_9MICO|nr:DUF1254 domain-containing protein [Microbacterium humi]SEC09482.1 Protein of unknown function [Microbacterium humi]